MALPRPQVFITGEIESASKCWPCQVITGSWRVQLGSMWSSHGGIAYGDLPISQTYFRQAIFNSPIDLNLSFSSPEMWPRIFVELFKVGRLGKSSLGEIAILLPNTPGRHKLTGRLCRAKGALLILEPTVTVTITVELVFSHLKSNSVATGTLNALDL
jgi:hypothetical protein